MRTKAIVTDFPKEKLKLLFLEARDVLILQPPELDLAIMTENFSAGVREGIRLELEAKRLERPAVILCSGFPDYFGNNPDFDQVISHAEYRDFLKQRQSKNRNLFVVDLSNDAHNKFLFEFDRMTKWPIRQRPFFSQTSFHWQNLPRAKDERNSIASRYLQLVEQIFNLNLFVKPRFPKIYKKADTEIIYQKISSKYEFEEDRLHQISFLYLSDAKVHEIDLNFVLNLIELLFRKRKNIELNILINEATYAIPGVREKLEKVSQKRGFSIFGPRKINIVMLENTEYIPFLSKQKIVIGSDSNFIHLANALAVKTISFRGPKSKHFVSNYRWDYSVYSVTSSCEYLKKTNSWQDKGYIAPCFFKDKCEFKSHCLKEINPEEVVNKIVEML